MNSELDDDGITIDFRFFEIGHEIYSLQEYFRTTEQQLPLLADKAYQQLLDEMADEVNFGGVSSYAHEFGENVLPRFFRSPVLVALWAIYESATTEIAKVLQKENNHSLRLQDIKGDNTLDTIRKYFEHVLKFPLINDENTREHLEMLLILRNAIAHGNGRKDAVNERYWRKIKGWQKDGKGVSTDQDYLTFSADFIEDMLTVVGDSLFDLIERVKAVI
jgi:hypothetical protein